MSLHCPACCGAGWVRRFTIGGHQQPMHCPRCGDGAVDPEGFEKSDLSIDQLKAQVRPSTNQHATAD